MSGRPASARKRSRSLARASVSPKVVVIPRIWTSGLRRARATAKASSMSSPMSVSMMAFSGEAGVGVDWAEQTCEAVKNPETAMKFKNVVSLDMCERPRLTEYGAEWKEKKFAAKFWCGREDSNLHALRR